MSIQCVERSCCNAYKVLRYPDTLHSVHTLLHLLRAAHRFLHAECNETLLLSSFRARVSLCGFLPRLSYARFVRCAYLTGRCCSVACNTVSRPGQRCAIRPDQAINAHTTARVIIFTSLGIIYIILARYSGTVACTIHQATTRSTDTQLHHIPRLEFDNKSKFLIQINFDSVEL